MKRKFIFSLTAVMLFSSAAYADYESINNGDGFTLGYYSEAENQTEHEKTEALFSARPRMLRSYDNLSRGLIAVHTDGGNLVSWRFLGTDNPDMTYNLYCDEKKLNDEPITTTNFFHKGATANAAYTLCEVKNGVEASGKAEASAWDNDYLEFPVTKREGYNIDDGAVGDLDGDGEYEILLRRTPSMDVKTRDSYPLIEAYKLDGTHMWTIDIGPNEINEVDINMLVYDLDGDGKSEVVLRSFEGTTDGAGNTIGDTNNDGITDYSKNEQNLAIFKDRQYIVSTPEFLSVYDGKTGAERGRTELLPSKEPLSSWSYRYSDTSRLTKRASHYLFGVAYLDGKTPSIVMVRGAWDNVKAAAWHFKCGSFTLDWELDTPNTEDVNSIWGSCNHNLATADIDFDGCDEIISGPMAIDNNGSQMYAVKTYDESGNAQKLLHGDAFDLAKMDPGYNGYLVWACHETSNLPANAELHDARTGQVFWGYGKNKDTGRSRSADIDPTKSGHEVWASTGTIPSSISGETLSDTWDGFNYYDASGNLTGTGSLPMNFKLYWDGDLLSEFLDNTTISKYNWEDKSVDTLKTLDGCASNSGTKAVPCLSADIMGDWREEVVMKTADESAIRIYSTAIPTDYKIYTLMHDPYYRTSVAVQNNHYNQPPNLSYYLGAETTEIPMFEGYIGDKSNTAFTDGEHKPLKIGDSEASVLSLKLQIGEKNALVGNQIQQIDESNPEVVPYIGGDRTLVPLRFIAETLGADVSYDNGLITISGNGYTIKMTVGEKNYTVNGVENTLDTPAVISNDRTFVPLRAIAEAMDFNVEWLDSSQLIYIGKNPMHSTDKSENVLNAFAASIKSGTVTEPEPEPTPVPTPEPERTVLDTVTYNGTPYNIYLAEDYSSYSDGDSAGWDGGTKSFESIAISNSKITFGKTGKGNRYADYSLPFAMTGKAYLYVDWDAGDCKGGDSYGVLRLR